MNTGQAQDERKKDLKKKPTDYDNLLCRTQTGGNISIEGAEKVRWMGGPLRGEKKEKLRSQVVRYAEKETV